jgi:hypothetical protein
MRALPVTAAMNALVLASRCDAQHSERARLSPNDEAVDRITRQVTLGGTGTRRRLCGGINLMNYA